MKLNLNEKHKRSKFYVKKTLDYVLVAISFLLPLTYSWTLWDASTVALSSYLLLFEIKFRKTVSAAFFLLFLSLLLLAIKEVKVAEHTFYIVFVLFIFSITKAIKIIIQDEKS